MPKVIDLKVDYDRGASWGSSPQDVADGVLVGWVDLRIRTKRILQCCWRGMNNSIISLLHSCFEDMRAASLEIEGSEFKENPMFFCTGALINNCGVINDFSVKHKNGEVIFSDFYSCDVPKTTVLTVPWRLWAIAVEEQSSRVLRRCPPVKVGVAEEYLPKYTELREELQQLRRRLRKTLRAGITPNKVAARRC